MRKGSSASSDTVAGRLPATAWQRQSAGNGAKGPRYYDWAWIHIGTGSHRHLLVRRNRSTGELAFYLCWSPTEVPLSEVVPAAGVRWSVEERFQAAKGQVGLDHYRRRTVDEPTGQLTKPHWSTNGVPLVRNAMRLCPSRRARPSLVPRSSTPTA
ncbi:hypothetical protein [Streptomyces sp. NBC_01023]|uniref:hypothetical protein n=1 Tax=Streptomyces sp. NBC_01023 TaxID=2903724 RepID=UPI00386E3A10